MARIINEHQDEILTFPKDTLLDLKIMESVVETVQGRNGDWQKVNLTFKILDVVALGDGSSNKEPYLNWIGQKVYGGVPFKLTDSPENKLRLWTEAIFNLPQLPLGFELDTDNFVGRSVRGVTMTYEKTSTDSQGRPYIGQRIESLIPLGGGMQAQQQAQAPAQAQGGWTGAQQAPQQDPWAAPAQPQQQQPVAAATPADPWGSSWGTDEPPF